MRDPLTRPKCNNEGERTVSRFITLVGSAAALMLAAGSAVAGDAAAGKAKFGTCAGCHGANGVSATPANPNLAGKDEAYIKAALIAYKTGAKDNATMKAMASSLSDADIDNIAAYVATLKP
jgi:cytochrome c553